jgi:hypothetical protein
MTVSDQLRTLGLWSATALTLNFAWEVAQLPLYTIYRDSEPRAIAYALAHCTAGDVLIAACTYLIATAAARTWRWPWQRPLAGVAAAILAGVAYTAFSEWLNVYVRGSWSYTDSMPLLAGIGVSPLLQWLLLPSLQLAIFRSIDKDQSAHPAAR